MIEARQEINSLLVTMTEPEVEVVRLICRRLADQRAGDEYLMPVLLLMLAPETRKN